MLHLPGFIVRSDVSDEERAAEIKSMRDYIRKRETLGSTLAIDTSVPITEHGERYLAVNERPQHANRDR